MSRESRPEANRAAVVSTGIKSETTLRPGVDWTGCPCGCLAGVDCVTERPAPDRDGHCCGRLDYDDLIAAARRGWHCQTACVFRRLHLEVVA